MTSRLFGVGIEGADLAPAEREILRAHPPFGAILFRRNIVSVEQLAQLIGELRELGVRELFLDQPLAGEHPQALVPAGWWQATETRGGWALVSCVVAPGFDFSGFELAPPCWIPAGPG